MLSPIGACHAGIKPNIYILINLTTEIKTEGNFQGGALNKILEERIVFLKDKEGRLVYPELQQYYVKWLGYYFWKQDLTFNVDNHVRLLTKEKIMRHEDLLALQKEWSETGAEKERSPWGCWIVENVETSKSNPTPCTMLFFKFHHSLGDGQALFDMLMECSDSKVPHYDSNSHRDRVSLVARTFKFLKNVLLFPCEVGRVFVSSIPASPLTAVEDEAVVSQQVTSSFSIPTSALRNVSLAHHVTFTTVLMTALSGALRNFFLSTNKEVPEIMGAEIYFPSKKRSPGLTNS